MTDSATTDPFLALAERVERGERGYDINTAIAKAFNWTFCGAYGWRHPERGPTPLPEYTTSLDAIAALQEAVLPGWRAVNIEQSATGWYFMLVRFERVRGVSATAPTLHQAWLAALLRALAMERKDE